jgi:copper chaperone NosL
MNATSTAAHSASLTGLQGARAETLGRWLSGGAAVLLLLIASTLPLWQAKLNAPQYPGGLDMIAYGDHVTGDVSEINILNHYIGMKPLKWNDIPERLLWTPALIAAVIAAAIAAVLHKGAARRTLTTLLWLFPVGVVADIQFRLFQYGHDLDPKSALRVPEFTIWVFGPTKVWNFSTWAWPGIGLLLMIAAAAVVTFGPRVVPWVRDAIEAERAEEAAGVA